MKIMIIVILAIGFSFLCLSLYTVLLWHERVRQIMSKWKGRIRERNKDRDCYVCGTRGPGRYFGLDDIVDVKLCYRCASDHDPKYVASCHCQRFWI